MLKKTLPLFAFLVAAALLPAGPAQAAKVQEVYNPEPIQVPSGKGANEVKSAIRRALFQRNWQVRELGAGRLEAKQVKAGRKGAEHIGVVSIEYSPTTVRITYKDSTDLNYDAGSNQIHKTYNRWVRNLEKDIRGALGAY